MPVSGAEYVAFGGNSCCVEVRCGERLFVVDAGSGIRPLGEHLVGEHVCTAAGGQAIDVLLSHLHLDHVIGLPFFRPALVRGNTIRVHVGILGGASGAEALGRLFSPPLFPLTLDEMPARFEHVGFRAGERLGFADGLSVATCPLLHPGGACAFRFDFGGRRVCYVSDVEHGPDWPPADLTGFVSNADLMIFDAMYAAEEYTRCKGWGHSTCEAGLALCAAGGVKAMAAFHLHPCHDDTRLLAYDARLRAALPGSFVARDGLAVSFPVLPNA
ncbi:MAG: MBL fold metallo-hydrolase [Pseudochelatococcus sp.]|jgi:phosphoribosyl 1,2-cyclic phosphodiesterase|uniref:MBL fold metallo-hydrolase n=1 Tax=Pseudochelatococcus sp. TaxID=2020869 RepID=UPI003D8FC4F7